MRDIPLFTTENGIANLILREIPYRAVAYVRIRETDDAETLIGECRDFCRSAGARKVYGMGHPALERYPFHTAMLRMERVRQSLPETDAVCRPVTEETLEFWRELYNRKMASVPNSAYMTIEDARKMLEKKDGYFAFREESMLGIGIASDGELKLLASTAPGAGADVALALMALLDSEKVTLEVASANSKAMALYNRLGFTEAEELSRWYEIL